MDSRGTAHSKMGIPTFVNGRVDRILKKVVRICIKNFNIVVNFETKEQRKLLLYEFKIIRTNIQPEFIDKSAIISTHACARP